MNQVWKKNWWIIFTVAAFFILSISGDAAHAQTDLDPSPPEETIKLIFLHHSVGENWLADDQGGLGLALQENNYFVSDTYYGWGPDGIGDRTDTLDWPLWFTGPDSQRFMDAVYNEFDANAAGYQYYTRTIPDPGGENQVIIFKSCFPNSDLGGRPNDPPAPGDDLAVGSAKYVYNQLLDYFATRPDKLFILITSPPMQNIQNPGNARAISNWLVNDWLDENNYTLNNVAIFDFYNVLTHPDNHHRYHDRQIEHSVNAGSDMLYYDWDGDDHPNPQGGQKATAEFIPLLNIYVNRWLTGDTTPIMVEETDEAPVGDEEPVEDPSPTEPVEVEEPENLPLPSGNAMIDDFEQGPHPEADYWVSYVDEAVDTTIVCNPASDLAYQGSRSLQIDFNVLPGSWASCELFYFVSRDWRGDGLQFYLRSNQEGLPLGLIFYYLQGVEAGASTVELKTPPESVEQWTLVTVPWEEFGRQDSLVYPEIGLGMAFAFSDRGGGANTGTIWIDDFGLITDAVEDTPEPIDDPVVEEETQTGSEQDDQGSPGICGNIPMLIGFVAVGMVGLRLQAKKQ